MSGKTIITCAVTGSITRPDQHPGLPITPKEIAASAIEAAKAGAAVAHLHVRDPETGAPSMELDLYREVVDLIRASDTDLVINLTGGPGSRFIPGQDDPRMAADGSTLMAPEKRIEHIVTLKPEMCTLDFNTMWFGSSAVINMPAISPLMAKPFVRRACCPSLKSSIPAISAWHSSSSTTTSSRALPCSNSCSAFATAFPERRKR